MTRREFLELKTGQVDVWLTSLSGLGDSQQLAYLGILPGSERAKWQRFAVQGARLQYLLTRVLIRTTLSRYAEVPEAAWQFETNQYGRPHVSHPSEFRGMEFNLSNTDGLVTCAVSRNREIGIDIENVGRALDADALAPTVFAPEELADFRRTPSETRRNRFFSYWTLKESYIKARGMGLSIPLDAFWFELRGASPLLRVTDRCPDVPERWRFFQYAPTDKHRMAVAVTTPWGVEPSIQLRWVTPMASDQGGAAALELGASISASPGLSG